MWGANVAPTPPNALREITGGSAPHGGSSPPGSPDPAGFDSRDALRQPVLRVDALQGPERWGDFTAINRDPLDGQNVATFNQYASTATQWQQFISVVTDT